MRQHRRERTMHQQICITANRAREMGVIGFGEPVVTERIGRISRFAQTSQKADFQCGFLRSSHHYFQKPLHFAPLRKIAYLNPVRPDLVSIVGESLRIRFLMNPVDGWNQSFSGLPGDQFVRQEHELLDKLMRNIVFLADKPDRLSFVIQNNAHFWHVQFQGTLLETPFSQNCGKPPGSMEIALQARSPVLAAKWQMLRDRSDGRRFE